MDVSPRNSRTPASKGKLSPQLGFMSTISAENLSPAQRHGLPRSPSSTSSEGDGPIPPVPVKPDLMRPVMRGAPGDSTLQANAYTVDADKVDMQRRRSKYYESAFATRGNEDDPVERVSKDAVIMVEVKTNVIVQDEYTFITDLSAMLSLRYQRPDSCIFVSLQHSACIMFGGSFDPTYAMSLTALPTLVQPTSNKRNAIMIQTWMQENLGVETQRGIIRFIPINNSDLAVGGKTMLAQQELLGGDDSRKSGSRKASRSQSMATGMLQAGEKMPPLPPPPKSAGGRSESVSVKKRKSFLRLFAGKDKD